LLVVTGVFRAAPEFRTIFVYSETTTTYSSAISDPAGLVNWHGVFEPSAAASTRLLSNS